MMLGARASSARYTVDGITSFRYCAPPALGMAADLIGCNSGNRLVRAVRPTVASGPNEGTGESRSGDTQDGSPWSPPAMGRLTGLPKNLPVIQLRALSA